MKPKVLLVEDDQTIREIYALKLELEGFPIETAENGQIGLSRVGEFGPNIILLDMMMPVMGGLEFMQELQAKGGHDGEVIVFSNISAPSQMQAVMKLGVADYWVKSDYTPDRLTSELVQRWEQKRAQTLA